MTDTRPAEAYDVAGRTVTLPVEVRIASAASAMFLTHAAAVDELLTGTGLTAARLPRGRALAVIATVHYVDNDLGPYDEVALALPVAAPRPTEPKGAYIHRLPVNGEFTCAAGQQIWGFPKWVTSIDLALSGGAARCELRDGADLILRMEVDRRRLPLPARATTMHAYSFRDGVLRRTPFRSEPTGVRGGPAGTRLEVGHGHPMADELRQLGLPKRALFSTTIANLHATFGAAEVVE